MTTMLKDCKTDSAEYKERYITRLIKKGLPHDMAEQDYEAWVRDVIVDIEERSPEMDADESFSYWVD